MIHTALLGTNGGTTPLLMPPLRCCYGPYGHAPVHRGEYAGFNGRRQEPGPGLYGLGNGRRFYSPALRRFLQPDSISPFAQRGSMQRPNRESEQASFFIRAAARYSCTFTSFKYGAGSAPRLANTRSLYQSMKFTTPNS